MNLIILILLGQAMPKLMVFDFERIGVDENVSYAIMRVLKDEIAGSQKFILIEPEFQPMSYSKELVCSLGQEYKIDKALIGSILKLGEKYTLSFQVINIANCEIEFADKVSTTQIEEMDVIAERIVEAISLKKPIEKTVEVGKVVEPEVPVFKTREPFMSLSMRVGYSLGIDPKMLTFESSLAYETKDIYTEALFGGRGREAGEFYFDLLLHKITSSKDLSTYFGGGIGMHYLTDIDRSDDGLALLLSGGLMGFRTYHFRILFNLKAGLVFTKEFGTVPSVGLTFGLTSPELKAKGNDLGGLATCLGGCLGVYLATLLFSTIIVP